MSKHTKKHVRRSTEQWRTLLAAFAGSGLTVDAFCRQNDLCASSFHRWRQALAVPTRKALMPAAQFIELSPASAPAPRWQFELDLGDGIVLRMAR